MCVCGLCVCVCVYVTQDSRSEADRLDVNQKHLIVLDFMGGARLLGILT